MFVGNPGGSYRKIEPGEASDTRFVFCLEVVVGEVHGQGVQHVPEVALYRSSLVRAHAGEFKIDRRILLSTPTESTSK